MKKDEVKNGSEIIDKITKRMIEMLKKEETISSIDMRYGIHIPSVFDDGTLTETISSVLDDFIEGKVIVPEANVEEIKKIIKYLLKDSATRLCRTDLKKVLELLGEEALRKE